MKQTQPRKALIFDMDGTMIDNMMVHHRAWQKQMQLEGYNYSLSEIIEHFHGKNLEILEQLFGSKYTEIERLRISNEKEKIYREIYKPELKLIDGLPELLAVAYENDIPMGIGTAAQYANVDMVLDTLNIRNYFDAIVADIDVEIGKPNPEVFHKVATKLGVNFENCLVFEDSPIGAKTAQNAGMKAIMITSTHKAHEFSGNKSVVKCINSYDEIDIMRELAYI